MTMITAQDLAELAIDPAKPIRIEKVKRKVGLSEYDRNRSLYTQDSLFELPNGDRLQSLNWEKVGRRHVIRCIQNDSEICHVMQSEITAGVQAGQIKVLTK